MCRVSIQCSEQIIQQRSNKINQPRTENPVCRDLSKTKRRLSLQNHSISWHTIYDMASIGPMPPWPTQRIGIGLRSAKTLFDGGNSWKRQSLRKDKDIATIQEAHCAISPCRMNGIDWMKHFISHL